jgi:hypothetical protein
MQLQRETLRLSLVVEVWPRDRGRPRVEAKDKLTGHSWGNLGSLKVTLWLIGITMQALEDATRAVASGEAVVAPLEAGAEDAVPTELILKSQSCFDPFSFFFSSCN